VWAVSYEAIKVLPFTTALKQISRELLYCLRSEHKARCLRQPRLGFKILLRQRTSQTLS
jgi:hypothetical protein